MKTSDLLRTIFRNLSRLLALYLLTILALSLCTGCKHSNGTAATDVAGVYELISVDGKPVPCETMHGRTPMTIHSGRFTINADGTCSSLMNFSNPRQTNINLQVKATYSSDGGKFTMKWERGGMTRGQVIANTFAMSNEGMVLAYQKQ